MIVINNVKKEKEIIQLSNRLKLKLSEKRQLKETNNVIADQNLSDTAESKQEIESQTLEQEKKPNKHNKRQSFKYLRFRHDFYRKIKKCSNY